MLGLTPRACKLHLLFPQAELNKREAWLAKAKGIIFEYQKRAQATMIPNSQQASAESDVAIAALPSQKR